MSERYHLHEMQRRGLMLVLSSPSGAGKTTISRQLMERDKNLTLSISTTTRGKRPGETNGTDYVFVDKLDFNKMVERGEFLEYAKVFGNYYGTPRTPVEAALASGKDVMFDIDWQGTQQLSEKARDDVVSVFVLPPSWRELERRLHQRAQDDNDEINKRMGKAADEMSHWAEYDYVIINNDLDASISAVQAILLSERLKRRRQIGLAEFVKGLQQGK
jgi:guanylate kinase